MPCKVLYIHLGEGLRDAPDEDVLRLEVPVDDVVLVKVLQGPGNRVSHKGILLRENESLKEMNRPRGKFLHLAQSELAMRNVHELSSTSVLNPIRGSCGN